MANQVVGQTQQEIPGAEAGGQPGVVQPPPTIPSPQDISNVATEPQGSPNIMQRAMGGIRNMIGI